LGFGNSSLWVESPRDILIARIDKLKILEESGEVVVDLSSMSNK